MASRGRPGKTPTGTLISHPNQPIPTPVLNSISPTGASIAAGNFTLTATGSGFTPESKISFNGVQVATTYVSPTQLTAAISVAGATAGSKNVMVVTGTKNSAIKVFTYSA